MTRSSQKRRGVTDVRTASYFGLACSLSLSHYTDDAVQQTLTNYKATKTMRCTLRLVAAENYAK